MRHVNKSVKLKTKFPKTQSLQTNYLYIQVILFTTRKIDIASGRIFIPLVIDKYSVFFKTTQRI